MHTSQYARIILLQQYSQYYSRTRARTLASMHTLEYVDNSTVLQGQQNYLIYYNAYVIIIILLLASMHTLMHICILASMHTLMHMHTTHVQYQSTRVQYVRVVCILRARMHNMLFLVLLVQYQLVWILARVLVCILLKRIHT